MEWVVDASFDSTTLSLQINVVMYTIMIDWIQKKSQKQGKWVQVTNQKVQEMSWDLSSSTTQMGISLPCWNELTLIYSAGSCFHCTLNQIQKHMNQKASSIDRNHEEYVTRVPRVDSKMVL